MIVVDSASQDSTVAIAESCSARTITIRREQFDHGATRNLGAAAACGDVLVFLTQDALPSGSMLLERLIEPLYESGCAASYGRQLPGPDANPTERFARFFNYPDTPAIKDRSRIAEMGIKAFFFSNVCSAVRADVFRRAGGFPHDLIMDEDLLFAAGLITSGYTIAYAPAACVVHSHNYGLLRQFRRYFDIGVFFGDNLRLLDDISLNQEGTKLLRRQLAYLFRTAAYRWIPYCLIETLVRYSAYRLGMRYKLVPEGLRPLLSMHRAFWENRRFRETGRQLRQGPRRR
jgi:rhamnosyltransferase